MAEEEDSTPKKFIVIGLLTSEDFQKCRHALMKLYKSFPKEFAAPDIRSLLDVEWNEFITKQRRKLGNGLWSIKNNVAVFKDGEFLGDFNALFEFIWKERRFVLNEDWSNLALRHLMEYLEDKTDHYVRILIPVRGILLFKHLIKLAIIWRAQKPISRQLVYLTIAIDNQVIGSLLFQLYNDIVPLASENFLNRCKNEINGYIGAPIHRIVKNSWIQCGGYELEPQKMPCENYVVPHDRRGVLSTCNNGAHKDNSTQFYITLDSAPWMNYKYVAFGQLLQGDDVLKAIADVPTYYQAPTSAITIVKCGEFKTRFQSGSSAFLFQPDDMDQWKQIQDQIDVLTYLQQYHGIMGSEGHDGRDSDDRAPALVKSRDSVFTPNKMPFGTYSLKSDLRSYAPFSHLPNFGSDGDEGDEDYNVCEPSFLLMRYRKKLLYDDNASPATSDMTV